LKLGIRVVSDLPDVGKNFMDHPSVIVTYRTRSFDAPVDDTPSAQVCLNYTAECAAFENDMRMFPFSTTKAGMLLGRRGDGLRQRLRFMRHPLTTGRALAGTSGRALIDDVRHRADLGIYCGVEVEESRGEVVPLSADPGISPKVEYRYLTASSDRARLRESVRLARDILRQPTFDSLGVEFTGMTDDEARSDSDLDRWIMYQVRTSSHTSGTCKMGPDSDPTAVVDQYCRVRGIDHLRVVDTSIMPSLVRRGTNATAVMIGERVSQFYDAPSGTAS
jgi:choline dehydrogenase